MRTLVGACSALVVFASATAAFAADLESGIEVGGKIKTYSTTKVCGVEDGVEDGKSLCYT